MKPAKQTKLDSFVEENSIIVVDIETTGFNPKTSCILEIGICKLDLNSGKLNKLFDATIKEPHFKPKDANAWIFSNSNLIYKEILGSKSLDYYRNEIQAIFDKYPATAYNKKFDFDFLKSRGFNIKELMCPMLAATNVIKLPPIKPNTLFKWPSFEETYSYYFPHRKYIELHRGFDDAEHEAQIVFMMFTLDHWKPIIE
jgi:DNA polymerase III alpha subunit (gram-positive type)